MNQLAHCPDPQVLDGYVRGRLGPDDESSVRHHLSNCGICRAITLRIELESGIIGPTTPLTAPRASEEVKPTVARGVTRSVAEMELADLSFLNPPKSSGEMGWLGPYRVLRPIGQGGMGLVLEAEEPALERRVALKVLRPDLAKDSESFQRFYREAKTGANLCHPNLVPIYQVGDFKNIPYLAMQFLEGETLDQWLEREPRLPAETALRIAREIAQGLSYAHKRGLIHRDIKPANVWIESPDGTVKILDFGLARSAGTPQDGLTATGLIMGTPHFMSPEQARNLELDGRTDLFSLGGVLYRMITGRLPFPGSDVMAILTALAVDEPPSPDSIVPDLDSRVTRLIRALLAKNRDDRPATADAVIEMIRAIEAGRTISIPLPTKFDRRRLMTGAGALAVAGLAGSFGWWYIRPRGATAPAGPAIRAGILHSLTGTMAASETAVEEATRLAIEELNREGGLLGRPIEPVVADGQSDPSLFRAEAERLIDRERVVVIFGCWTSASRRTVRPVIERRDHLLFYPVQYEGLEQSPNIVYLGATPNQQILPAVQWAAGILNKRRFFLAGSDYVFPRTANAIIRDALSARGAEVVGEEYVLLGDSDVRPVIDAIRASRPDIVLNTINGDSNIAFFRALRSAGVHPDEVPTLSFSIAENELRSFKSRTMIGDYAAWNYFQSIDRPENAAFITKFKDRYGKERVTSDPMEAAYVGVKLWAQAVREAGDADPKSVRRAIGGQSYAAPQGTIRIDPENRHAWKTVRIGRIVEGGQFEVCWSSERPIRPEPYPPSRTREEWDAYLNALHAGWGGEWANPG